MKTSPYLWFAFGVVAGMVIWAGISNQIRVSPPTNDKIQLLSLAPDDVVESPLIVAGRARGTWFFEASFPIELRTAAGQLLTTGIAQAQGDWMTEDFVNFEAKLIFNPGSATEGELIFKKDNPSGLPENDDQVVVPVRFE